MIIMKKKIASNRTLFHRIDPKDEPTRVDSLSFSGASSDEFKQWRKASIRTLREVLGRKPGKVPLQSEVIESAPGDGYLQEKVIYNVENDLSASAWICSPLSSRRKHPAVLCCHGHGPGKDPLIGRINGRALLEYHKMISVKLARAGYVTITPDRRGYGDCSQFNNGVPARDDLICLDSFYKSRGSHLLACDLWDGIQGVELLASLDCVNNDRIGCVGIADGASVAALTAVMDERIKVLSLTSFVNDEGMLPSVIPLPDECRMIGSKILCSLIAPRPLLLQMPEADPLFPLSSAMKGAESIVSVYELLGDVGKIKSFTFDGVLELDYHSIIQWFDQWLKDEVK